MLVKDLILADRLAVENTLLANERTLLSFFRSSVFFLATGISILKIHFLSEIPFIGWFFVLLSPILLIIGIYRYYAVKKHIKNIIEQYAQTK